jgi:hypothetical protein
MYTLYASIQTSQKGIRTNECFWNRIKTQESEMKLIDSDHSNVCRILAY